jgi:hypothetical protein
MRPLKRAREVQRKEGAYVLLKQTGRFALSPLQQLYNRRVWPDLPATAEYGTYNGVAVIGADPPYTNAGQTPIQHKYFDRLVPWMTPSLIPDFKRPNVRAIQEHCVKGQTVTTIGGGYGVTAVHAARRVGSSGRVVIYEGDTERIESLQNTLQQNNVADVCEIVNNIVGEAYAVGNKTTGPTVEADELPHCDVLEMDCEGAELKILEQMTSWPATVIVELHHCKEFAPYSSPVRVRNILEARGYSVKKYNGPWVDGLLVANTQSGDRD